MPTTPKQKQKTQQKTPYFKSKWFNVEHINKHKLYTYHSNNETTKTENCTPPENKMYEYMLKYKKKYSATNSFKYKL